MSAESGTSNHPSIIDAIVKLLDGLDVVTPALVIHSDGSDSHESQVEQLNKRCDAMFHAGLTSGNINVLMVKIFRQTPDPKIRLAAIPLLSRFEMWLTTVLSTIPAAHADIFLNALRAYRADFNEEEGRVYDSS